MTSTMPQGPIRIVVGKPVEVQKLPPGVDVRSEAGQKCVLHGPDCSSDLSVRVCCAEFAARSTGCYAPALL